MLEKLSNCIGKIIVDETPASRVRSKGCHDLDSNESGHSPVVPDPMITTNSTGIRKRLEPASPIARKRCSVCGSREVWPKKHGMCAHHYRQWYNANHRDPVKQLARVNRFFRGNPAKRLLWSCRLRARHQGCAFDLDEAWVQQRLDNGICEATGIPFALDPSQTGRGAARNFHTPSVDRIDPKQGYVKSNCRLVIWQFNLAKGPYSDRDVLLMARALVRRAFFASLSAP